MKAKLTFTKYEEATPTAPTSNNEFVEESCNRPVTARWTHAFQTTVGVGEPRGFNSLGHFIGGVSNNCATGFSICDRARVLIYILKNHLIALKYTLKHSLIKNKLISTPTCFGPIRPSSGRYGNKQHSDSTKPVLATDTSTTKGPNNLI